jgi:hypothetical protein
MINHYYWQEHNHVPIDRVLGPLPENAFVAAARDTIPVATVRITTTSTRGTLRGRSRGKGITNREDSTRTPSHQQNSRGRGNGRGNSKKRRSDATRAATAGATETIAAERERAEKRGYDKGPGSGYYLLFGDDQQRSEIPDLNTQVIPDLNLEEFPISQNAPNGDEI